MSSVVDICNMALSNIRAGSINSLTENSLPAQLCTLKYPICVRHMLETASYQFAHKLTPLVLTEHKVFNWNYAYAYPSDCWHINRLVGEYEEINSSSASTQVSRFRDDDLRPVGAIAPLIPYSIFNVDFMGTRVVAANEVNLRIDYRSNTVDPVLFSADFTLALAHLLASEIAIAIVGGALGSKMRQEELTIYEVYMAASVANDFNEQHPPRDESPYVTVRR